MAKGPTVKGPLEGKADVDFKLLTADERAALDAQAEQSLLDEMKQQTRDEYYAQKMKSLRQAKIPAERMTQIHIAAAPYVPFFMIDGERFYHGYTYKVRVSQALVLLEQMQRSWWHQDEIDGRRKSTQYRSPADMRIGLSQVGAPTHGFAGNTIHAEIGDGDRVTGT